MSRQIQVTDGRKDAGLSSAKKPKYQAAVPTWIKSLNPRTLIGSVLILLLILFAAEYIHTKNQLESIKRPATGLNQAQQIINQVGGTLQLPNETPTLAKVTDVTKLQSNILFKNAQNGDVVLVYPKSGWALLYRPSTGKVIEYSPYQTSNGQ